MKRTSSILSLGTLAFLLGLPCSPAIAQTSGSITGTVLDAGSGEPVVRASVALVGTRLGAISNTSGSFTIRNVPPGTYALKVSYIGYAPRIIEGITVAEGGTARHDVMLSEQVSKNDTVVVSSRANRNSEGAALTERKRSSTVSDAISADQIAKAPASDAGEAMKRVTGVSVVANKFVVVRGLSERYNATQLNGVNLPSPEPEKKVVPFDLFPTNMVGRLTTVKTFTPDNPGDFAGGLVKITTKDIPEQFLFSFSASTGMNSETQGAAAVGYPGGRTDYLGVDDGTRALPFDLPPGRRTTAAEQADLLGRFTNNAFLPRGASMPVNQSYSLSLGNQFDVGFPLGVMFAGSYAASSSYRAMQESYPLLSRTGTRHDLRYDYTTQTAERSTLWGGLLSITAQPSPEHKVSVKGVYNHTSDDETRLAQGLYNQSTSGDIRSTRLRFLERSLASGQIDGEHKLAWLFDSRVEWRAAISAARREEPDNRTTTYLKWEDGIYRFANNFGSNNGRFFSDLNDRESTVGLDWSIPFAAPGTGSGRLKVGGVLRERSREFDARRFVYGTTGSDAGLLARAPEELFTAANVAAGLVTFNDETQRTDNYDADESINAAYAMVDMPLGVGLRFVGGVRMEQWQLDLSPIDIASGETDATLATHRNLSDLLPSINLIYSVDEAMNLRAAFSRTLARPEFREIAPFRFDDYRQSTYGNPALTRTSIVNLDLRWEWFRRAGEVIAASAFYKDFTDPIEQFYLVGGSDIAVEPANAAKAASFGAEFEFRSSLDIISESLAPLSLGTNLTLVQSSVSFDSTKFLRVFDGVAITDYSSAVLTNRERPLQGQSPFVVNVSLAYDVQDWGTGITANYNMFGRRLAFVGTNGIPDTYEQSRGSLDMVITQRLPFGLQARLAGRNLLDSEHRLDQTFPDGETVAVERYHSGRTITIGLGFSID